MLPLCGVRWFDLIGQLLSLATADDIVLSRFDVCVAWFVDSKPRPDKNTVRGSRQGGCIGEDSKTRYHVGMRTDPMRARSRRAVIGNLIN
jgi:hypothetical protein